MKKLYILFALIVAVIAGCKKYDYDTVSKGEALGTFRITAPVTNTNLALNSATPNNSIDITWTASAPGVGTAPTYKWVAALKTGNIDTPLIEIPSNNGGKDTRLTLTYQQLDAALAAKGIAAASVTDFIWSVVADNGFTKVRSSDVFNMTITRFGDGVTPFSIYGPLSSNNIIELDPGSTSNQLVFRWQSAIPTDPSKAVQYRLQIVNENDPLAAPWVLDVLSDNNGADTTKTFTHQAFSDSLTAHGFTDPGQIAQLKWRVLATSGNFSLASDFSNIIYLIREVKMYMVGSFQGWDPPTGLRMIPDNRPGLQNSMFYAYVFLPANTEFKFLQGQAWGLPDYGAGSGDNLNPGGSNIQVSTAGWYRVSMNKTTLKYNIMEGRMGFVGGAVLGVDWNPSAVFPTAAMGAIATNKFLGIYNFGTGGWKMIDNNEWNNGSNSVDETRSYGSTGPSGSLLKVNSDNMPDITTAGRYRVIWDGTDVKAVKYEMYAANEMRVVGDGLNIPGVNDWDPGTSPQMTYIGNGIWSAVLALKANKEIKFLAGDAWGAFDYESAGGGKIKYDGGSNFTTPTTAGTYTITLNEHTQTYTIL